jgi:hypothetical protein
MNSESAVKNMSVMRTVIGAAAWVAPNLAGKAFMLDVDGNPQAPYLARLFGIRDVALGAATAQTNGDARRKLLTLGVAVDAADAAAAVLGARKGYFSPVTGMLLAAPAIAAVGMGIMALQGDGQPQAA